MASLQPLPFWGRSRGKTFRLVAPRQPKVAVFGDLTDLEMVNTEQRVASFNLVRFVTRETACSVWWEVVPTGATPLLPEHFVGGVYPSGQVSWAPGAESIVPQSFTLAAAESPFTPLTAQLFLRDALSADIDADFATLDVVVQAVTINLGDAIVGLRVLFSEIDPEEEEPVADPFTLASWTTNWTKHANNTFATVTQLPTGVRLAGGPTGGGLSANGVAIWSRETWEGDFRVSFKTNKKDAGNGSAQEQFLLFFFGMKGTGSSPVNLAAWPANTVAFSHTYRNVCNGARISFYYQDPSDTNESHEVGPALFHATTSVIDMTGPTVTQARNTVLDWLIEREGDTLRIKVNGGAFTSDTEAQLSTYADAGNFGFLANAGRTVEVTDFVVEELA